MHKLFHHMALSADECYNALESSGQNTHPGYQNGTLWCNATWDSVLCWPAIPANTSYAIGCPPLKGLDTEKTITKRCHASGRWVGRNDTDFTNPSGWTDFIGCMWLDHEAAEKAQEIARGLRNLEFVGLGLSFVSLVLAIAILTFFRRLRVFRNQIHLQLFLAILLTVITRLVVYIDLIFTEQLGSLQASDISYTINTTKIVCEAFYFLLEYGKTVAFAWMFIEGFYLHNTVVVAVFQEAPKLWKYLLIGWGLPLVHVTIWLIVFVLKREVERCLGLYYLHPDFWIMDAVRLAELVANTGFLLNIVRVLWYKVKDQQQAGTDSQQLKKSVKAALMLIPLLGIPNIMQTIPFRPTRHNITWFAVFTYIASFFYMFQGFMVAMVYCFTNREVILVLKSSYERYRLNHSTVEILRRGSRNNTNTSYHRGSRAKSQDHGSLLSPNDPRLPSPSRDHRQRTPTPPSVDLPLLPPPSYETVVGELALEQRRLLRPPNVPPLDDTKLIANGSSVVVRVEDHDEDADDNDSMRRNKSSSDFHSARSEPLESARSTLNGHAVIFSSADLDSSRRTPRDSSERQQTNSQIV